MRKTYDDDLCDRCRVNPKDLPYILCAKCRDEWIAFGVKIMDTKKVLVSREDFEVWFTVQKKKGFVFR
jgi:hypothetical protein